MIQPVNHPRFTLGVAVPTMNRPQFLRAAIRSALRQRRAPDEVYVLDNSRERDETLQAEFDGAPIRYRHVPVRMPVEEAFTRVLRETETDYVCLLEDDNLFGPDHLAILSEAIAFRPEVSVFSTAAFVFHDTDGPIQRSIFAPCWSHSLPDASPLYLEPAVALATLLFGTPLCASATAVRRETMREAPLTHCGCRSPHDRWRWAQLAARHGLVYMPRVTAWFRVHDSNISNDIPRSQHRAENWCVTKLVMGLMEQNGLDPAAWTRRLSERLTPNARRFLAGELLRHRNLALTRRILPPLLGQPHFRACLPGLPRLLLNTRLRRLRP